MRTPITCQPGSVAAALATQKEQAACDVIAYQGYQALIQHQAGLVLLGGCKASREPALQACIESSLDLRAARTHLRAPLCCDGMIATFTYHQCTIANTNTQTTLACLHTRTHARMRTRSTSVCLHMLVQLCYGHKHRVQTSCGICNHASNECG